MGCIYMYTNNINDKKYIGKSHGNVKRRQAAHISGKGSQLLKKAFTKYGTENFTFEVLYDSILDAFLDDYEREAIKKYNTNASRSNGWGYNLTDGGEGKLGHSPSVETRRKISKAQKGKRLSKEHRRKLSEAQKGKKHSAERRKINSEAQKGKKRSAEACRKMSESIKGENHPMYGRRGKNNPNYGTKRSQETRRKMSETKKGKTFSDEHKRKLSESHKGNVPSNRIPEYNEAKAFFLSFSPDMPIETKRKKLYSKYPHILKERIRKWVRKWQSETS